MSETIRRVICLMMVLSTSLIAQGFNERKEGIAGFPPEAIVTIGEQVGDYRKLVFEQLDGSKEAVWTDCRITRPKWRFDDPNLSHSIGSSFGSMPSLISFSLEAKETYIYADSYAQAEEVLVNACNEYVKNYGTKNPIKISKLKFREDKSRNRCIVVMCDSEMPGLYCHFLVKNNSTYDWLLIYDVLHGKILTIDDVYIPTSAEYAKNHFKEGINFMRISFADKLFKDGSFIDIDPKEHSCLIYGMNLRLKNTSLTVNRDHFTPQFKELIDKIFGFEKSKIIYHK